MAETLKKSILSSQMYMEMIQMRDSYVQTHEISHSKLVIIIIESAPCRPLSVKRIFAVQGQRKPG